MWGFAHLSEFPGACFVTTAVQKSKGVADEHNVARAFVKARSLVASAETIDPSADIHVVIFTSRDFAGPKRSSADYRALECSCGR
jgi:hypothetical protein